MSNPVITSDHTLGPWMLTSSVAGAMTSPEQLVSPNWTPDVPVPGTVAQALRNAGQWDFSVPRDFDEEDWWYRCEFLAPALGGARHVLRFAGLATLAQVWLNGQSILQSDNMFQAHTVDVSAHLRPRNELVIVFRSLNAALAQRRPRPRWKTKLVRQQQLRWIRTTVLGRIPGWSPPVAPVGPWRAITLERHDASALIDVDLLPRLDGTQRVLEFRAVLPANGAHKISGILHVGPASAPVAVAPDDAGYALVANLSNIDLALWWPHTLGDPALHNCKLVLSIDGREIVHDLGHVGFRRVEVNSQEGQFELRVNGVPLFCRGACWTSNDIVTLTGDTATLSRTLHLARDGQMNMLRVGGTMVYEQDAFYQRCDELGILVWQDFMFANMDYPIEDAAFRASVERETQQQLRRLRRHTCLAIYCGNSEVEQQAAMVGTARELWRSPLFAQVLPEMIQRWHPGMPYVPSTPSGGVMPFHVGTGITHYYGVGAYLRDVAQVRRDNVKFTPECLGFSNVPEPAVVDELFGGDTPATHHPLWKARVPRDTGPGWDFEDVRDFYMGQLYDVDPVHTRCFDTARYLALGRVATGEMMAQVFSEWRSAHSGCRGALVWFLQDLWPGAGWGVLDSRGLPKACYYYLRRAWQPLGLVLTNEGLDGVHVHVINETSQPFNGTVEFRLLHAGRTITATGQASCAVAPRATQVYSSDALLAGFYDVSYAYRFGPPKHEVVIATLRDTNGACLHDAFLFPQQHDLQHRAGQVTALAQPAGDDLWQLTISSDTFLYAVAIDAKGYLPLDNYLHVIPGQPRRVLCRKIAPDTGAFKGYVDAMNFDEPIKIQVVAPA